jgi:hypothetical protein
MVVMLVYVCLTYNFEKKIKASDRLQMLFLNFFLISYRICQLIYGYIVSVRLSCTVDLSIVENLFLVVV